ncbi:hypothetical protein [Niabella beijingensis]|uniref:hypothetical protein n=1 Tax=Niabella beijingensis TaxID=2872700 RepID=UPI001CBD404F|nr:hypothetical protein [Niabella beijingensis]MBZ4192617.1 hypothetical protein [Niabella beijingensis]
MIKNNVTDTPFLGFEYAPETLIKYVEAAGIFTILLSGGAIVHFHPDKVEAFRNWLKEHKVPDARTQYTKYL